MEIIYTKIPGVLLIKTQKFEDNRGWFMETFNESNQLFDFKDAQDNVSFTKHKGTIRGMHLQIKDASQGKIVTCLKGKLIDVVYDLREESPTYLQKATFELSDENNYLLLIPRGLAHGFQTLSDDVLFMYKCDNVYNKLSERCISYLDKTLNMDWPIKDVIISEKDKLGLTTEEYKNSLHTVLLIGGSGLLGRALKKQLEDLKFNVLAPTHKELDITKDFILDKYFLKYKPDIVINCAAYTNVNNAEKEARLCIITNVVGTANVTKACELINSKLVYISTEYVFDGTKQSPYIPSDKAHPLNLYGYTKMLGENIVKDYKKHFIIRTSWLYDNYGSGFPQKIINLANNHKEITVVDDQVGSPTYVQDLAEGISKIISTDNYGIYHLTNQGYCSFYELANKVKELNDLDLIIKPISSEEYRKEHPDSVLRPKNSRMIDDIHHIELPNYEDALIRCLKKDNQ